jgi:hypothetical protein
VIALAAPLARAQWPWSNNEPVGSAEWWKKEKRYATFDPDKGYTVEGQQGYFDGSGRPIEGPMAPEQIIAAGEAS